MEFLYIMSWQIAVQLARQGTLSESAVANEVVEPNKAQAEGVDEVSQNMAGSDTKVEAERVETSSHEQTTETPVVAVTLQTGDQMQSNAKQRIDLKVSYATVCLSS